MIDMVRDLSAHSGYANSALLRTIRQHAIAARDSEILALMRHIVVANRFWLLSCLGRAFVLEEQSRGLDSVKSLTVAYHRTYDEQTAWLALATENDLAQQLSNPLIPGRRCSVLQALTQVCLHSHGHRAQCAKLLRRLGIEPPVMDFIVWLPDRSEANWVD